MMRLLPAALAAAALLSAAPAYAQQRPLVTEDPETIGSGLILLEGGFDLHHEVFYPLSGLTGNQLKFPTVGVSFGISSIAEVQIDGGIYNRLTITSREPAPLSNQLDFTGDRTSSVEDLVIATKIRLLPETAGRPSFGVRFATRLPNASNESGLGLDTTDFFVSGLVGKTVQSIRFVGNAGLGISVARAVREGLEVVGEVNGRLNTRDGDPPAGTESRGQFRVGGRFTRSTVRVDAGLIVGMTSRDPKVGLTAGFTWVFKGFTIP